MQRRTFLTDSTKFALLASLFPAESFFKSGQTEKPLRLIIDADTANEVDDLYAIARALLEPRLDVIGLTSAQWHTNPRTPNDSVGESQRINLEISKLVTGYFEFTQGILLEVDSKYAVIDTALNFSGSLPMLIPFS